MKSLYCLKSIDAPNFRKDGSREKVLVLFMKIIWQSVVFDILLLDLIFIRANQIMGFDKQNTIKDSF